MIILNRLVYDEFVRHLKFCATYSYFKSVGIKPLAPPPPHPSKTHKIQSPFTLHLLKYTLLASCLREEIYIAPTEASLFRVCIFSQKPNRKLQRLRRQLTEVLIHVLRMLTITQSAIRNATIRNEYLQHTVSSCRRREEQTLKFVQSTSAQSSAQIICATDDLCDIPAKYYYISEKRAK